MRGLVTAPDGGDVLVRGARWHAPVGPGGVIGVPEASEVPFGLLEIVVVAGRGAGEVHRLEMGRYRCGPDEDCDVVLPSAEPWALDVRAGGEVHLGLDAWSLWPVGERRDVCGLSLQLRWCAAPRTAPREEPDPCLADLLLDRLAGTPVEPTTPTWVLGRDSAGRLVRGALSDHPVLTVSGPDRHAAARGILARLVAACSADEVRLTVLAPERDAAAWAWTRWLPHARCPGDRFVRVGTDDASCARLVGEAVQSTHPWEVVVVDGTPGPPGGVIRSGLAVLVLQEQPEPTGPIDGLHVVTGSSPRVEGGPEGPLSLDLPGTAWADRLARALTTADDEPCGDRLADLLDLDPADADALSRRWAGPVSTSVPIGRGERGVVSVDLRADGPHTLIAGTTGSGKSELLRTLVTGLAALNPPEAMTFVLLDYKGGAAFAECSRLPHVLGVVTDLDSAQTGRALASLSAEIRRRERLLADAGAVDIDAYAAVATDPLARLVIVVDEFATLMGELPDFIDGLVDIARRGRSLGVHLVLATQRPAGAVSAEIRSNTTLRIALRVAEVEDSVDVIGVPDAAYLDEQQPGRAIVRVGRTAPVVVQVSRVTGVAGESSLPYVFGEPVLAVTQGPTELAVLATTMQQVVARRGVPVPPSPWLPPLRADLHLDDLLLHGGSLGEAPQGEARLGRVPVDDAPLDDAYLDGADRDDAPLGEVLSGNESHDLRRRDGLPLLNPPTSGLVFGMEDRADEQRQVPAVLPLVGGGSLAVVGTARSGRTATLSTLVAAATRSFTPTEMHVYGIDASSHGLSRLGDVPHVGAVVAPGDGRIDRLVERLGRELDRRLMALAGRMENSDETWPFVLVVVDRWDLLVEALEVDDRTVVSTLERLATDGARVGMTVVATGDRTLLTGRMMGVFADRLVLRLADPYDYAMLGFGAAAGQGEPGRGWRGERGVETQVALAELPAGEPFTAAGGPFRVEPLPTVVTRNEVLHAAAEGRLLVGVGGDDLEPVGIDADEFGPTLLVTGPRRSGRSGTLLTLAESARGAGWQVVVVTGRRSPLAPFAAVEEGVHGPFARDEDAEEFREVVGRCAAAGRVLVVADDVDLLMEGPLLDELTRLPAQLRDTGSLFVASGEAVEVMAAYRGPLPALRRARCGVMLSPLAPEDGEAFGVRLRRSEYARPRSPGAGLLVLDGLTDRVQVLRSAHLPPPTSAR